MSELIIVFLIANTLIFGLAILVNGIKETKKYEKEKEEAKLKQKEIQETIVKSNLDLAKTYESMMANQDQRKDNLEFQAQSFSQAITETFKEITGGKDDD